MTMTTPNPPMRAEQMSTVQMRLQLLQGMRAALIHELLPVVSDENTAATLHLILRLLDKLGEDAFADTPSLAGRSGLPQALADELGALLARTPGSLAGSDLSAIGDALAQVLARTDRASPDQAEACFVRKLAQHERQALARLDRHGGGSADTYAKGLTQVDAEDDRKRVAPQLGERAIENVLRRSGRYGDAPRVSQLQEIPGGFNKLTASFKVTADGLEESLILRRDAVPNPTGFSVVDEFPVLKAVFAAGGVPMAEPLLVEHDPALLGSPALVVRRMPGSTDIAQWRDDPAAGRALAQELARALARLHAIDVPEVLSHGAGQRNASACTAAEVERWYQRSLQWRIRPSPALDAGFAWARANIPRSSRKPVFVHGDVGFHNMLMERGHLTALLDWEFSHLGDPMEDLNYCKPFVTAVCDWSVFLEAYHAAGGVAFDPAAEAFFELWPSLRNGSGCDALMRCFLENPGSDLKFAVAGTQHVRQYENAVLAFLGCRPESAADAS